MAANLTDKQRSIHKILQDPQTVRQMVNVILDETGSMTACLQATLNGFNEYLENLRKEPSQITFTLTKFNSSRIEILHDAVPLSQVPSLTSHAYTPADLTPLYDAIGKTIRNIDHAIKRSGTKPDKVLIVIITDGLENASREFDRKDILQLIQEKERQGWMFAYLGANQDQWTVEQVTQSLGIAKSSAMSYGYAETNVAFQALSQSTVAYCQADKTTTKNFFSNQDTALTLPHNHADDHTCACGH